MAPFDFLRRFREKGVTVALRRIARRLWPERAPPHPFDVAHGTDTGGLLRDARLRTGHPNDRHSTAYWGTAPSLLRGALARWRETLVDHSAADYSFIDIGSGKGRALMLASELPFRRIVGVELNPTLHAAAERNLALWGRTRHACTDVVSLCADALTVELPDMPVLVYLFHPFDAVVLKQLLERLQRLADGRTQPLDVLYVRPEHGDLFTRSSGWTMLWAGEVPFSPEDTAADIFQTIQQRCIVYRLLPARG